LKRLCTVGWALTALIVLGLYADHPDLLADADRVWAVAAKELLGPLRLGLVGLMLACFLAALMSCLDAYMLVGSALVVRNLYVPYLAPDADEARCLRVGRITGFLIVAGAVAFSLGIWDMWTQLQLSWIVPVVFAAPFWVGILWRRATRSAAFGTVVATAVVFFVLPWAVPRVRPELREDPRFLVERLPYRWLGLDLADARHATLDTLDLLPRILAPFLLLVLLSLVTPRVRAEALDRYLAKMRTPVAPTPDADRARLDRAYQHAATAAREGLWLPRTGLTVARPARGDVAGFLWCVAACSAIVGLAVVLARLGAAP